MLSKNDKCKLDTLYEKFRDSATHFIGFPGNLDFDYQELTRFLQFSINNIGDPFEGGLYNINTHDFEREVLEFFAKLYHIPKRDFWGYVTSGGTEGNMYGLYLAREACPDGMVYFSEDTHYSIQKIVKILNIPHAQISSMDNGEIDYLGLRKSIKSHRGHPPIFVANIGTTMKGAVDKVEVFLQILEELGITRYYIHCDAALGGMILPFLPHTPLFDFRLPIGSIAVSGHKMIGSPTPCGIVIARKKNVERIQKNIEYIGTLDTTISGSRNGHSVLYLWYAIKKYGKSGFKKRVNDCHNLAIYCLSELENISWTSWKASNYNTVIIAKPPECIIKKWQLAIQGNMAHVIIMPHTKKEQIDHFIRDLKAL